MTARPPSRKLGRKGVEAIFSPAEEQRDAKFLIGLGGIVAGILLWTTVVLRSTYPKLLGTSEIASYLSMALSAIGLILVIDGAAICAANWRSRVSYGDYDIGGYAEPSGGSSDSSRQSIMPSVPKRVSARQAGILSTPNVKNGLVTFVQGCVLVVLYSGLADEYESNASMQRWVRSVFPAGRYFLNWEAILVVSIVVALVVTQFLPGRFLSE